MTGLDCLREELAKRGLTAQQYESKTVAVVLDVLASSGDRYTEMWKAEVGTTKRQKEAERALYHAENEKKRYDALIEQAKDDLKAYERKAKEIEEYINKMCAVLEECETAEGRDVMRTAQMFVNSVTVDTKYDNTAYIIGLATILSQGGISGIDELRKINKKLPGGDDATGFKPGGEIGGTRKKWRV